MKIANKLQERLLWRELDTGSRIKGIYGDRTWVNELDIVNELGGHSGCVNALSWSTSGRLLASGSDDQHLNIHTYQPDSSTVPFSLTTTVATGHVANIFSVKFMPHSNDTTLVTAAGDAEVRVFDIEYSGRNAGSSQQSNVATTARGQRFQSRYHGVKYLSDGNTNARIFRSHADRVKRIVTESSPHLFLTCSEDGEVRQFDLRMPSSAYPPPKGGRGFLAHREDHDDSNVPPPLISYKRYNLDLNTISCSASQPHYIALGGAHLHCFLHDRRMLGRNLEEEQGKVGQSPSDDDMSSEADISMSKATRCVRRFAPEGRAKAARAENRHITACKISDANPNELIVSWSGDHIYSFDLIRSPNSQQDTLVNNSSLRRKTSGGQRIDRRKKRKQTASSVSLDKSHRDLKQRSTKSPERRIESTIRATYEGGATEDLGMDDIAPPTRRSMLEDARTSVLPESQTRSLQIAKSSVKIRKLLFSLEASPHNSKASSDPSSHRVSFTSALGFAASCYPEMKSISGSWRYPVDPLEEDVILQQTLRGNRNSSQRFVQAAGTLARVLGGKLQTASSSTSPILNLFKVVSPLQPEGPPLSNREVFALTFLKAVLLWLEGGNEALLQGFKRPPDQRRNDQSFPIPDEADRSAIHEILIPQLLSLSSDAPLFSVDASRFEIDESRKIFDTEKLAVIAFGNAIKMPLQDLSKARMPLSSAQREDSNTMAQDRHVALKYWGFKVGRSLLMRAGEGIDFQFVDVSFGGLGNTTLEEDKNRDEIDPDEDDPVIEEVSLISRSVAPGHSNEGAQGENGSHQTDHDYARQQRISKERGEGSNSDEDENVNKDESDGNDEDYKGTSDEDDDDNNDDNDDDDDDDDDDNAGQQRFIFSSAFARSRQREKVELDVPCFSHNRTYKGHCNVKTVKDANFFGLQDEYVVSGSDGGHVFIWDKVTSQLVNILEGDGEIVNVIQGHPYEPVLAVSGIDHTIKIFSPDARAQEDAKNGINIANNMHGSRGHSSISPFSRRRGRNSSPDNNEDGTDSHACSTGLTSRKRMQQEYEIVSQNDVRRQGGMREAYITRGMLAQVAARLRARRADGEDDGSPAGLGGLIVGDDGEAIVVDDNCSVM